MAENKTQPTDANVTAFLDSVPDERRRAEGHQVCEIMERITGAEPVMWGPSIVGFGSMAYTDDVPPKLWPVVGFSPRKTALSVYGVYDGYSPPDPLFEDLGPHTTGVGCLYLKRLDAVDLDVLETLVRNAWKRSGA